jgi:glycosyltransferase involved in cell wall biosynthesis
VTVLATIVIPAYNAAARIEIPLRALSKQKLDNARFEVVVVDNASSDGTRSRVERSEAASELTARGCPLRVVAEPRPGLTSARLRGLREAASGIVCFLDDDNEPATGYVQTGLDAMMRRADVGVLVSRVFPRYQTEPPSSVRKREHLLAINHRLGDREIEWPGDCTVAPTLGAGMWIRRDAGIAALTSGHPLLADRVGDRLTSGGDIELGLRIGGMGLKRLYVPELVLYHHIPESRLRCRYVCRLILGIVRSELTLGQRYDRLGRAAVRARAIPSVMFALLSLPALMLRRDGLREAAFVVVARWARVLGPY